MKSLFGILLPLWTLILSDRVLVLGQKQNMFLDQYKETIQNYIMTGHEKGWNQCDILSDSFSYEDTQQLSMDLYKIKTMNTKSTLASSQCLLVTYQVDSQASLSALLDFGLEAIHHVRLALVLKLKSGVTLDMATNTTKLPFLVASVSELAKEQFLCPVIGEREPRLEQEMCKPSYVSPQNKIIRITQLGVEPDFIFSSNGGHDGINIRIMKILREKFNFKSEIIVPDNFIAGDELVCNNTYILLLLYEIAHASINYSLIREKLTSV